MRFWLSFFFAVAGALCQQPWDIAALEAIALPADPQMRPDGGAYAYVYQGKVYQAAVDGSQPLEAGAGRSPRWAPNGQFLAWIDPDGKVRSSHGKTLTTVPVVSYALARDGGVFYLAREGDAAPNPIVVGTEYQRQRLYRDGAAVSKAGRHVIAFAVSPAGDKVAYAVQRTSLNRDVFHVDLYELNLQTGEETVLVAQPGRDSDPSYSPDGRWVAFHSQAGSLNYFEARHVGLVPSGGGAIRYLTAGLAYDVFRGGNVFTWSLDGRHLIYTAGKGTRDFLLKQELAGGGVEVLIERIAGAASFSHDLGRAVLLKAGISRPPEIVLLDGAGQRQLTDFHAGLKAYPRVHAQLVEWKSSDGVEVEGVLWLPVGYQPKKRFPLLVELHGGPTGVTLDSFPVSRTYPVVAFLQAGFGVFSPNFRGSSNYGAGFRLKNVLAQGMGDYQDVMSGVDHLIREGFVDASRMGVYGWSYGGYLTGAIISRTNRFKAASIGAPATDWTTYYGQFDGAKEVLWTYFGGTPWDVPENYERHSYRSRLKDIRTPALLQVGALDINHNAEIYQALTDTATPVEYVVYPREGHSIVERAHQRDLMERNLRWFKRWVLGVEP